jgi:octaprenyl-diphosphate synthase
MTNNPQVVVPSAKEDAPGPERFLYLIRDKLVATEQVFHESLATDVPFIRDAGEYIFAGGGKRVRPAMLLLSADLLGCDGDEEVTYGAVVELIHTATLVHDDIIDHSSLRRGQTTPNRLWGNSRTVLLGDWLYTTAMKLALSHDNLEVIQCLVNATLRMTEGELLTLERLGSLDLSVDEYFSIIDRKTAELFGAACFVPSLIEPVQPAAGEALRAYGKALGLCYQLTDDLLDFTAQEDDLGKPVLSDLKEGKLTLPLILLLPRVGERERGWIGTVLEDRGFERVAPEQILELVESEGTVDEVQELARSRADEAIRQISELPGGVAREALEFAPDYVLSRRS